MNLDAKDAWLTKLREKGRPQTTGRLMQANHVLVRRPVGQCCLGVLCEAAIEAGVEIEPRVDDLEGDVDFVYLTAAGDELKTGSWLPQPVQEWAGLDFADPIVGLGTKDETTLSSLNDKGVKFKAIAKIIEEQL